MLKRLDMSDDGHLFKSLCFRTFKFTRIASLFKKTRFCEINVTTESLKISQSRKNNPIF